MKNKTVFFTLLLLVFVMSSKTPAATLTLEHDAAFPGAQPSDDPTWLTATFDDAIGDTHTVRLTLSTHGLTNNEFVGKWLFNFDPTLDPTLLTFAAVDSTDSVPNDILTGADAFKVDGGNAGWYDIKFDFPPPGGDFSDKFTAGESVVYDLVYTGSDTINAYSFNQQSITSDGEDSYRAAAHIQAIGSENASAWVAVTEPSATLLSGLGLLALGLCGRKLVS